ncbi:hypothetical protein VOLCADRAFT_105478 [Volvox carteri f. nagariensis]|uniref:CS domain-containing protein n=1 Tax=Volvox carteri f. nagariensis TaxID=3068 RepID=D8U136_VOLCA|nr:uncharacterized protein VOLCADRAFT_105478 [Volvox carteri f. nagariensis]EFJ46490.1 hypothetical protein VOLCADRAFT_105478 [Volvox carteri f. nagariensis]|eukprot:XP_002952347.1 hypothetical protein VOLCADRAFT_105478 [Volvox carteri f. nagariensis]
MTVNAAEAAEQQVEQIQATEKPLEEEQQWEQDIPEHQTSEQEQPQAKNALQANIEEKRERSYYYAHAPRSTSEEPAPPPVPVVLERSVAEVTPSVVTIFNYAWADDGEVVKVYIPLEGVGEKCSDDDIKATFETRLFQVDVHGFKPGQVQRLLISKLSGEISPDGCRARKLANKLVVTLKKMGSSKWYSLRSNA